MLSCFGAWRRGVRCLSSDTHAVEAHNHSTTFASESENAVCIGPSVHCDQAVDAHCAMCVAKPTVAPGVGLHRSRTRRFEALRPRNTGQGIVDDVKRTLGTHWRSEMTNFNQKTVAISFFVFFACIAPAITFGAMYAKFTHYYIGAVEMIAATAWVSHAH